MSVLAAHRSRSGVRALAFLLSCAPQLTLTLPRHDAAAPAMMRVKNPQGGGAFLVQLELSARRYLA